MIFYDFEVFKEDWLAVFIDVTRKKEYVIINNPVCVQKKKTEKHTAVVVETFSLSHRKVW